MNIGDFIGVRCDRISKGMFSNERTVYIGDMPYIVNCATLVFNRQAEVFYVKVIRIIETGGKFVARINANDGFEDVVVDKESLIHR